MKKICPACGREEQKDEFINAFCEGCYSERHEIFALPRLIEITTCPTCGKTPAGELIPQDKLVSQAILGKLRSQHDLKEYSIAMSREGKHQVAHVTLVFSIAGKKVSKQARVIVRVYKKQCSTCSRKSSGYFEAIIQFRSAGEADAEKVEKKALKAMALLEKTTFIPRTERFKEGIDVFVGSASEAQKVLHDMGLSYTLSKKLAGVRRGRRISRTTFCARV